MHNKYKKEIISIIRKHIPSCKIYLYGSRARNEQRMGSDIDIALETNQKINPLTIAEIKEEIEETTTMPLFIDLIDINAVDSSFKSEVMKDWVSWND